MWHLWTRFGWEPLSKYTIPLIENFQNNHDGTNWIEYKSKVSYFYEETITYKFSLPTKEMIKQYDLLDGDICSIMIIHRDYFGTCKHGFTIIRNIQDESMKKEIKNGKKPKFFYA